MEFLDVSRTMSISWDILLGHTMEAKWGHRLSRYSQLSSEFRVFYDKFNTHYLRPQYIKRRVPLR